MPTTDIDVLRYAAFTTDPAGGNPAGVVLDATGLAEERMLAVAAAVGYSETAFVTPGDGDRAHRIRYFSPLAEVPFCGHATVAAAVALADRHGPGTLRFATSVGDVPVDVDIVDGRSRATLTSVAPSVSDVDAGDLADTLALLGWAPGDLDPALPPRVAYAGAHHPVLAAATRDRLARLEYGMAPLAALMTRLGWTTLQLVWREAPDVFHVRNPFPVGGVYEDPATGAAAAALGGYLRALGEVTPPATLTLLQGYDLGRPSRITVELRPDEPGVRVSGFAVPLL